MTDKCVGAEEKKDAAWDGERKCNKEEINAVLSQEWILASKGRKSEWRKKGCLLMGKREGRERVLLGGQWQIMVKELADRPPSSASVVPYFGLRLSCTFSEWFVRLACLSSLESPPFSWLAFAGSDLKCVESFRKQGQGGLIRIVRAAKFNGDWQSTQSGHWSLVADTTSSGPRPSAILRACCTCSLCTSQYLAHLSGRRTFPPE